MFDDHLHHHSGDGAADDNGNRTVKVRPSQSVSLVAALVGGLMLLFFLGSGGLSGFGSFGLIWIVGVVAIIGLHLANVTRGSKGPGVYEIDLPDGGNSDASVDERLEKLVDLRERGAISSDEYRSQRQRILDEL